MTRTYVVKGMSCNHCRSTVEKAIANLEGVESVSVDLSTGNAVVEGEVAPEVVKEAIEKAGFDCAGC